LSISALAAGILKNRLHHSFQNGPCSQEAKSLQSEILYFFVEIFLFSREKSRIQSEIAKSRILGYLQVESTALTRFGVKEKFKV
jgi:hypothetical protein